MNVYLVVNEENCPGRVLAVFADKNDAENFADSYFNREEGCDVVERTLFYGQPPVIGYNK
jgi:hypothetical protein